MAKKPPLAASANPYRLLEVDPRARPEVIKGAYNALMKVVHPDHGGDEATFTAVTEAYKTLSDPARRAAFDAKAKPGKGTVIGSFRILEELAEGGFGTTYKGEHVRTRMPVCIKYCSEISAQAEEVLVNETNSIWDLKHFGLPVMRDLLTLDDGSLALVMSYEEGPTLEQVVEKIGRIDPEHVAWITERILNALLYLHRHGVVHGDLKPQNIIIKPKEHLVSLIDFGLAMIKPDKGARSSGYTPLFAPPEQEKGGVLLPESDFYSLGMTMIYALSGDLKRTARREIPSDVPEPLCDFIRSLIVRDVLARPNWDKSNVYEDYLDVRKRSFGRGRSDMKPLPGF
ncbi:MAG: serine/threonine protein kinase [Candidatus Parcubacteria bacterium]|jgi:serine/threonine protein kinase